MVTSDDHPPRNRTRVLIVTAAVALALAGGTAAVVLTGGDEEPARDPAPAAEPGTTTSARPTGTGAPTTDPTGTRSDRTPSEPAGTPTTDVPNTTGSTDPAAPSDRRRVRGAVNSYLKAINTKNEAAATKLTCEQRDAGVVYDTATQSDITLTVVDGTVSVDGASATVNIRPVDPEHGSNELPLPLERRGGDWCVSL